MSLELGRKLKPNLQKTGSGFPKTKLNSSSKAACFTLGATIRQSKMGVINQYQCPRALCKVKSGVVRVKQLPA